MFEVVRHAFVLVLPVKTHCECNAQVQEWVIWFDELCMLPLYFYFFLIAVVSRVCLGMVQRVLFLLHGEGFL